MELQAAYAGKSKSPEELVRRMREGNFQILQVPGYLKDYQGLSMLEDANFPQCFELLASFPSGYRLFIPKETEENSCV
jgi:hypothetical protein